MRCTLGYISISSGKARARGIYRGDKQYADQAPPATGDTLVTRITVLQEVFNITLVHAVVSVENETIAETDLKIALGNDEAQKQ